MIEVFVISSSVFIVTAIYVAIIEIQKYNLGAPRISWPHWTAGAAINAFFFSGGQAGVIPEIVGNTLSIVGGLVFLGAVMVWWSK